jgi:hypothetical protein
MAGRIRSGHGERPYEMPVNRISLEAKMRDVFGQRRKLANVFAPAAASSAEAFEQTLGFVIVNGHETASIVFVRIDVRVF